MVSVGVFWERIVVYGSAYQLVVYASLVAALVLFDLKTTSPRRLHPMMGAGLSQWLVIMLLVSSMVVYELVWKGY